MYTTYHLAKRMSFMKLSIVNKYEYGASRNPGAFTLVLQVASREVTSAIQYLT